MVVGGMCGGSRGHAWQGVCMKVAEFPKLALIQGILLSLLI